MNHRNRKKSNWELISNPVAVATWSDDAYQQAMIDFLVQDAGATLERRLSVLLKTQKFRKNLNAFNPTISKFLQASIPVNSIAYSNVWALYQAIILASYEELNKYAQWRDAIQKNIIVGDYKRAEQLLDAAHEALGDSFWYIKTKFTLLSLQKKSTDIELCSLEWQKESSTSFVKYFITTFQIIADTDANAHLHWGNFVKSVTEEFKESGQYQTVEFINLFCTPELLAERDFNPIVIKYLQALPLVDLYNGVLHILKIAASMNEDAINNYLPENLQKFHGKLLVNIDDPVLKRLSSNEQQLLANAGCSPSGKEIVRKYERADYAGCIDGFRNDIDALNNPLSYANIIAKAVAYTGHSGFDDDKSFMGELIRDLASVYRLNQESSTARDRIISRMIQMHGVLPSSGVQLTLAIALPYLYPSRTVQQMMYGAIFESSEITPLIAAAIQGRDPDQLVRRDVSAIGEADPQRTLRREICSAIDAKVASDEILEKFDKLKSSGVLQKDYLELLAHFCLSRDLQERLLSETSHAIVANPNLHICLPLRKMVESIENLKVVSLDSIIVCDAYNRKVSVDKDYVLNETFEDFLNAHEVERPSQLLLRKECVDARDIKFFGEICTPEVMDFLSCFVDSDDLRAERMEILDLLLDIHAVDPNERMKEVEFLVGQTLIDSMTNQLNGPKIYVDNEYIKRKSQTEVEGLLRNYRIAAARDDDHERVTLLDPQFNEADGSHRAYVTGGRANAVLKMRSVIANTFMFDEKHGLDKNLSTEIRHGFFSNLMRARVEERHLITEADEHGIYKPNDHWLRAHEFLIPSVREDIDRALARFSKEFDRHVSIAEGWMQIGNGEGNGPFMELTTQQVEQLKSAASVAQSADQLVETVLLDIWAQTEIWLTDIRERLNVVFRKRIDDIFDELESDVVEIASGAALLEFMSSLRKARGELSEDISTAAEWFRRASSVDFGTTAADNVIRAAASAFEKVKALTGAVAVNMQLDVKHVQIGGHAVKPLVIAIINLLDNCFTHSGYGRDTRVTLNVDVNQEFCTICIANKLTPGKRDHLSEQFIDELNAKARSKSSMLLLRAEGGSGVSKAYQQIISSRPNSNLEVSTNDDEFIARISYSCQITVH